MITHLVSFTNTTHPSSTCPQHISPQNRVTPLNMDITGHFESASCVVQVDGSATLAQVKEKLLAELGVPRARNVGVRMRGGGDIGDGDDDLRICDTEMDEGCAVELYCTGANITPGVIQALDITYVLTLSPCDRYLAVLSQFDVSVFDTETHECLCSFTCFPACNPAFSPCSEWISCVNSDTQRSEVRHVKTGALEHSFGDVGDERLATAWSPCGTKLLSCCKNKGLQVWDIATGVVVHEWVHIAECLYGMLPTGDRVVMFGNSKDITIWDYTTGAEELVLTCLSPSIAVVLSPNQRFVASLCNDCVRVWNIETGECVFEDVSENEWANVDVSNDIVAAYSPNTVRMWSISTGKQLFRHELDSGFSCGLAISSCGGVMMCAGDEGVEIIDISHLS